jgi:urease accessory protein
MSVVTFPSEARLPGYIRAKGRIAARFAPTPRGTRALQLAETGGYRMMFPRADGCEAMILNTAGGTAGGDGLDVDLTLEADAAVVVSTQSAEKIYRAQGDPARASIRIALGRGARLCWLPQETILFNGAGLERRIEADLAPGATLTICEMTVFGRAAMGEQPTAIRLDDRWRFRREGRLVHVAATRLDGDAAAILAGRALGGGARGVATLLRLAEDGADLCDALRDALEGSGVDWGVSAWNGMVAVRLAGRDAAMVRRALIAALAAVPDAELPRVWGW